MTQAAITLAKLAGLRKTVAARLSNAQSQYFDTAEVTEDYGLYERLSQELRVELPALFGDLPVRAIPSGSGTSDNQGRGYIEREHLTRLLRDIDYIFETRSHSELASPADSTEEDRVFLSHGRAADWREVQSFIERDLGIKTLELAQEPNRGRTVLQKLEEESSRCSYAVVVMTGDDQVTDGQPRARENVMHEIGYFQGKFGLARVCLLHEEATSIPSNIHGLVYIPFPKSMVGAAFGALARELRDVMVQHPSASVRIGA